MGFGRRLFSVIAVLTSLRFGEGAAVINANLQEFLVLCRIASLSEKEPEIPTFKVETNVTSIVDDLRHFTILTTKKREKPAQELREDWLAANLQDLSKNVTAKYAEHLAKIYQIAEGLEKPCLEWEKRESGLKDKIKLSLKQGVYGTSGQVTAQSTVQAPGVLPADVFVAATANGASYAASCKAGVDQVGKTLINDIYCLCVTEGSSSSQAVCANGISVTGGQWPQMGSSVNFPGSWATIYGKCPKSAEKCSAVAINNSIEAFRSLIGKHVANTVTGDAARYIFGNAAAGTDCDGNGGSGGNCVSYKTVMEKNDKGIENIPWVEKYWDAARQLDEAHQLVEKCKINTHRLQILHSQAVFLFNESVADAEPSSQARLHRGQASQDAQTALKNKEDLPGNSQSSSFATSSGVAYPISCFFIIILA